MSSKLKSVLLAFLALLLLAPVLVLVLALQTEPTVPQPDMITASETRVLEQLIVDNSPARFSSRGERIVTLNADELDLLAAFGSNNIAQLDRFAADFTLGDSIALIRLSTPWPSASSGLFLNLQLEFAQDGDQLILKRLHAGDLRLPRFAVAALSSRLQQELATLAREYTQVAALQRSIRHVALRDGLVDIHVQWEPGLLSDLRTHAQQLFLSNSDRERILLYYQQIAAIAAQAPEDSRRISLQTFVPSLFALALERTGSGNEPVAENRALLQALSLYVNQLPVEQLLMDPDETAEDTRYIHVSLQRRDDLSQHFVSAAAIAASAGVGIAEVLSNSKEVYDARYRSGFNFADMTANAAGMALGNTATRDESSARRIQQRLAYASAESDYMPSTEGLMTGLSEQDLADEYNDRDDPRYREKMSEIEALVAALPVYQGDRQ